MSSAYLTPSGVYGCQSQRVSRLTARRRARALRVTALLLLWCALLGPSGASGQNVQHTKNAADLKLRGELKVNPSTRAVEFSIPLVNYPGRAGFDLPVTLSYSSKVWRIAFQGYNPSAGYTITAALYSGTAGWTSSLGIPERDFSGDNEVYNQNGGPTGSNCSTGCYTVRRILFKMPDGSVHELRATDEPANVFGAPPPSDNYYAVDGSRMRYQFSTNTLFMSDGSRYLLNSPTRYVDRHGNTLTYDAATRSWSDTLGRTVGDPLAATLNAQGEAVYPVPGGGGNYTLKWRSLSTPGVLTTPQSLRYVANIGCPNSSEQGGTPALFSSGSDNTYICNAGGPGEFFDAAVLHQVVLPTGRAYTFTYNVYGEIDKVVLPTGGYERYEYAQFSGLSPMNFPYAGANRGVIKRHVSATGSAADERTWVYSGSGGLVVIDAPDGSRNERYMHTDSVMSGTFGYSAGSTRAGMAYEERAYSKLDPATNTRQLLRRKLTEWAVTGSNASGAFPTVQQNANRNPRTVKEVELILDRTGNALSKVTTYGYDTAHQFTTGVNQTSVSEFGFAEVAQATAQSGAITSMPAGPLLRKTETAYLDTGNQSYRDRNILGLPTSLTIRNGANVAVAQTAMNYDEAAYPLLACGATVGWADPGTTARGNVTTTRRWLDTSAVWLESHAQLDHCGNLRNSRDAKGNLSQVEYSATFHHAYPTKTISPVPDPSGASGSTTALETTTAYEFSTGLVTSTTDANGQTTTYSYSGDDAVRDPLNRLRKVTRPTGGGWTKHTYGVSTSAGLVSHYVETYNALDASRSTLSYQFFDGLGRPHRTFAYEGAAAGTFVTTDTQYDSMGRVWRVSNPYRTTGSASAVNPSGRWTTTAYDVLGRVVSETTPDDPARDQLPAGDPARHGTFANDAKVLTSYDGHRTRVTDEDGKVRDTYTDALGRVDSVVEDPAALGYGTTYEYDALGKLREVAQGTQRRYFMYDSLGRLIRAKNPEQAVNGSITGTDPITGNTQWSLSYSYDSNGNLTQRTDPRGVVTTYGYDNLNRNTTISYTDGTPNVTRRYDSMPNSRGSLWRTATGSDSRELSDYDATGRPRRHRQWLNIGNGWRYYDTTYTYDLAGNVTGQTYPTGHTTSYQSDAAGRFSGFSGTLGDGIARTYATGVSYDEAGRVRQEQYGTQTPVYNKSFYNVRGQLSEIRVSTYSITTAGQETNWNRGALINHYSNQTWAQSGKDNNGNLRKQDVYIPADDAVSSYSLTTSFYFYDALNRIAAASEVRNGQNSFVQDFDYDAYGNRTINAAATFGVNEKQFTVNDANNRLGVPAGQAGSMVYDNAGNLTTDTYSGFGTRIYNAENRITQETNTAGVVTARYTYDGDGKRTRRVAGGQEWWYVYGLGGELLAEYGSSFPWLAQQEYGYRAGELLVTGSGYGEQGLQGDYFNSLDFTAPAMTRTDPTVNFEWHSAAPGALVNADIFTARWTGYVTPRYSQTYTFYTQSDDGVRLWVDDQLLVDKWIDQGWTEWTGQIALQAGRRYKIKMEFYERAGGAIAKLLWASASQAKEVVPASQLSPPGGGSAVNWLVADQIGTARMVIDRTGSLSKVTRHDYLPFGEELGAGVGGRTTAQGYSQLDGVRMKFTGAERDEETGLDFMQARYYSSAMGRFTRPDDFWKDSDIGDPQSWNKYAYVRNNPLKFIDPTGEKAKVKIETNEEEKKGTINITASIAIYSKGKSNLSDEQLKQAKEAIEKSIESAWTGTFEKDGITYSVTTDVTVEVHGSEDAATKSGSDNVIGISRGDSIPGKAISHVDDRGFFTRESAPDTGTWKFDRVVNGAQAGHEFTHLLGADNTGNRKNVSFSPHIGDLQHVTRYGNATAFDFRHALGGAINAHQKSSIYRTNPCCPYPGLRAPGIAVGGPRSHTSVRILHR